MSPESACQKSSNVKILCIEHSEQITIDDFISACRDEVQVPLAEETIRAVAGSAALVTFRRFRAGSGALRESRLYAASDTDHSRTRWYTSDDSAPLETRRMITYCELMTLPALLRDYLQWLREDRVHRPARAGFRALTLHCSSCDARWLLDGNHQFVTVCASGEERVFTVTEMTSPELGMRGCQCTPRDAQAVSARA